MKTCSKCKIEKPFEDFNKRKASNDGRAYTCKVCNASYQKSHREANPDKYEHYQVRDREKKAASMKLWREANADHIAIYDETYRQVNAAEIKKRKSAYREANRDKEIQYSRRYYAENIERTREYYKENTDIFRRNKHKRRARLANTTSDNWQASEVFESSDWKCFYCGVDVVQPNRAEIGYQPNEAQADHFMPLAKGGTNERKNIVCSCGQCNLSKRDKNPFEFIRDNINGG